MRAFGGYWVFPGGAVDATDHSLEYTACRELLEEAGLAVDTRALHRWAHWITPSAQRTRFDTTFFIVQSPRDQNINVTTEESSEGRWIPLSVCAAPVPTTELAMMPPTIFVLRELAEAVQANGSLGLTLERADLRTPLTVIPKVVVEGAHSMVVFPWDPEYAALPGEGVDWDANARSKRSQWPSRMTSRPQRI